MIESEPNTQTYATVLLVDDQPEQIDVIRAALDRHFSVKVASGGKDALRIAAAGEVDLILLDIAMPGMSGYEVCCELKNNQATSHIPIIFLSTNDSYDDEDIGLQLGAVDFIRKPSNPSIILTRSRNTILSHRDHKDLVKRNSELERFIKIREDMERMSRHDLKGPLSVMLGVPQALMDEDNLTREQLSLLKMAERNGYCMLEMVNKSLDLYKMEVGTYELKAEKLDLIEILTRVVNDLGRKSSYKGITIEIIRDGDHHENGGQFCVVGEKLLCYPLFSNLVLNAIEASCDNSEIRIQLSTSNGWRIIRITNPGEVPPAIRGRFFDKYVTSGKESGTGLGTYSAWLSARTQGGTVLLDTSIDGLTSVVVTLPGPEAVS
ncbi:MAG: hybrid sensor histidine kinase/response regulator [Magnetococcales bacterium]|nr:hybrid sensor histidine kinase/response regulator [Magnetococcales bacterium]